MNLGLGGRVVVIDGGDDGLGPACAAVFTAEGAQVVPTVDHAVEEFGRVDVVVVIPPAAGPLDLDLSADALDAAWEPVLDAVRTYQQALGPMEARGWGRFVYVTTTGVKEVNGDELDLVSGLAMLGLHKCVGWEAGPSAVTANAVLRNDAVSDAEVADAVAFLASDRAGYLSGITLAVDAGTTSAVY